MKIGIVNDMDFATRAISATLAGTGSHQVIWSARDGKEAIRRCRENKPDLVLMDLVMPGLNGVETTRQIMAETPTGILVVTASVAGNCGLAFQAMGAGALDVIATPTLNHPDGQREFLQKIEQLRSIIEEHQNHHRHPAPSGPNHLSCAKAGAAEGVVAIGSSAGGPAALAEILRNLEPLNKTAIVIIQHIDARFVDDLGRWLAGFSQFPLTIAREGDVVEPGTIYLAGSAGHLEMQRCSRLRYDSNLRGLAYQPSVDVFFSSVARHWPGRALGIVLTGMGRDGASGLQLMSAAGFATISQDQSTSALYGMPKAAAPFSNEILPLPNIAPRINRWIKSRK